MGAVVDTFAACSGKSGNKSDDDSYQRPLPAKHETRKENEPAQREQTSLHESFRRKTDSVVDPDLDHQRSDQEGVGTGDLFGYQFNNEGELCDNAGLRFGQKGAKTVDQDTFSRLTANITAIVQENLVNVHGLEKISVPVNASDNEPQSFIFASRNARTTTGKLLILIHGSGSVVAGIWSKKVIMYDNLYKGSQLSYVEQAINDGFEVVVLNTNVNSKFVKVDTWKGRVPIRESSNPVEHALHVWDYFIMKSKAEHIAIVAHSYGGVVTTELAKKRKDNFLRRVFAVAFTDSVHHLSQKGTSPEVVRFFCDNARNWVTSDKVLDTPVDRNKKQPLSDAPKVSAGDLRHEWTSHSALRSVFAFFNQKFRARMSGAQTSLADPKA